ncbi:MAG TPA: PAS domain S-box protein [Blastocatellia bacterium]|nr:PAS domain S-box protein [Blastocatellia bacterium]
MSGKPGKSLPAGWRDDAQPPITQLWDEIEARFGVCPSFFKLAQCEPPIVRSLFQMAEFAYLDNPMPADFKERLFTWLSRFCVVRYCVARHCAFLLGRGHVAGDPSAPQLSADQALALLKEPMPAKEELPEYLRALEATPAPLDDWPDFDSDLGRRLRVACAAAFLDPSQATPWLQALRRLLGPQRFEQLMLFLAFVRNAHFWTEVHPELAFDPDVEEMLREQEALVEPLLLGGDEAVRWELGQRLYDELQSLRERQKSRESIHESESRFKAIFENAAVGIARVAPDGHWLEVNQRLCDILGYSREELLTKTFTDITYPDDMEADLRVAQRMLAGEIDTSRLEKRYYRKDGSVVWANLTVSLLRKADGSSDYFVAIIEDISARKQTEEKLREREERLRLASRAAGLGVFEWDVKADHAVWENDRMYEIFGHTRADGSLSKERLIERYVHPDDAATLERALADGMKSGRPIHTTYRIRRKDGAHRWLDLAGNFELARDGAPIKMIAVLADITEHKLAEEAKLKRAALLAEVSAALAEHDAPLKSMLQKSAEALVRHMDAAFARIWTLNPKESLLELQASAGLYTHLDGRHSRVPVGEFKIGLIAKERQPHLTNDVATDPRISDPEWAREQGMVAFAGYPLLAGDRVVGVMAMFARHPLAEDTVEAIATVAAPIAQGIERKRAEDALRASEEQFRILADTAPVLIWMSGTDKLCNFFNKPWLDYTGRAMEEEMGNGWTEGVHPEDYDRCLGIYTTSFEAQEEFEMEYRLRRHDGEYRWLLDHGLPRFSFSGAFLGYIGSCIDITERREIEEALRESELRFRIMISAIPNLTYETDADGANIFTSDQWRAYTGMTAEESAGEGFIRAYHPDEAEEVLAQWSAAVLSGGSFERKCRIRAADGRYRWFLNRALPGRDAEGRIVRWAGSLTDIDGLIRAEEKARENELRFRAMISAVPSLTFESDVDGNNTFASDQWSAFTGMTAEETAGWGFARAIHPDDAEDVMARWIAAMRSGKLFESRHRMRAADGSYRWFLCRALPARDAEGRIVRWAGSLVDIDDLARANEALRESEGRFRQLAESLPQLVWTCRADGTCDYLSPQFVAYTGIPEAKQLGFDWLQQLHPDDREPTIATWNQTVATGDPFDIEQRIRRNDGVYRWFKTRAAALRDSGGKVVKWFGSNTDIDDQKQAERSSLESKERLNGIVSSAMDAIITVDEDQRVVLFNEAAERMFGCPAAEVLGQPFNRFIPERFRGAYAELLRRFGETGGLSRAMRWLTALRADGAEFPIEAAISKIEVGGRRLYTFIQRDITERKQAEAEREQLAQEQAARAAAEAANRSKDEFLALVSHELRSPLNAILGYTRMLRSGAVDKDSINHITAIVERSAKSQLQIIEDLLDSARIITGKLRIDLEPVDLAQALEASLDTVRSAAEAKGVTLIADLGRQPEQVLGDSTRLQQVAWNLLTNAVKFTPEGGRVELRIQGAADNVQIKVSDTGKGIEPELAPFIFDPFRQADSSSARRYGGLGLGLSLVKHVVELHGGTVEAESEGAGRGATFTVTLPRPRFEFIAPPPPAVVSRDVRTEGAIAIDQTLSLEGVSVLVVDDQREARELLTQALSEYGAQVAAVSSGAEALAFLSNPPGGKRPDALIMDIAMPDEDGYAALKRVRQMEAARGAAADQIPAIALTAFGRSEDRMRALRAGFQMHVAKPVEPVELAVVIASLTTRRVWERERKV